MSAQEKAFAGSRLGETQAADGAWQLLSFPC